MNPPRDKPCQESDKREALSPWVLPALLPGAWFEAPRDVERDFLARMDQLNTARNGSVPFTSAQIERVRFIDLSFFKEWLLCEVQVNLKPGWKGLACLVYGPSGMLLMEGSGSPIHAISKNDLRPLEERETGPAYLRFFCSMVRGEKGRFQIVEPESPLTFKPGISDNERQNFLEMLEPLKIDTEVDFSLNAAALSVYDSDLYRCKYEIERNGIVKMVDDEQLSTDVPLLGENYLGPFRIWRESNGSKQ